MNNMKKYSEKILPASHGLLKNPDGYVIIMFMSIFLRGFYYAGL
jgi:hypothetical protein